MKEPRSKNNKPGVVSHFAILATISAVSLGIAKCIDTLNAQLHTPATNPASLEEKNDALSRNNKQRDSAFTSTSFPNSQTVY